MAYLKPLPNMLHVLQAHGIDLQRRTLLLHFNQNFPGSDITCGVFTGKLNGLLRILQSRL